LENLVKDGIIESEYRKEPRKTLGYKLTKHVQNELMVMNQPAKTIRFETAGLYEATGKLPKWEGSEPWEIYNMKISGEIEVKSNVDIDFKAESRIRSSILQAIDDSFRKVFSDRLGEKINLQLHGWFTLEPKHELSKEETRIHKCFYDSMKHFEEDNMLEWMAEAGRLAAILSQDKSLDAVMVNVIQKRIEEHPLTYAEVEVDVDEDGMPSPMSPLPLPGRADIQSLLDETFFQFKQGKIESYDFCKQLLALLLFYDYLLNWYRKELPEYTEEEVERICKEIEEKEEKDWKMIEDYRIRVWGPPENASKEEIEHFQKTLQEGKEAHLERARKRIREERKDLTYKRRIEDFLKKLWGTDKFSAVMKQIEKSN
jgi:hypothetical protein